LFGPERATLTGQRSWNLLVARKYLSHAFAPAALIAELSPEAIKSFLVRQVQRSSHCFPGHFGFGRFREYANFLLQLSDELAFAEALRLAGCARASWSAAPARNLPQRFSQALSPTVVSFGDYRFDYLSKTRLTHLRCVLINTGQLT
jgi:hypothetical protein